MLYLEEVKRGGRRDEKDQNMFIHFLFGMFVFNSSEIHYIYIYIYIYIIFIQ